MARLPLVLEEQVSLGMKSAYHGVSQAESGLATTYQALFASPEIASQLANLDEVLCGPVSAFHPWQHIWAGRQWTQDHLTSSIMYQFLLSQLLTFSLTSYSLTKL